MSKPKIKKTVHVHGCKTCHVRFEDNCTTPKVDGECVRCLGGIASELLRQGRYPRECCFKYGRLARKDEKETYSLTGQHHWYICPDCKRTHPTKPKRETAST